MKTILLLTLCTLLSFSLSAKLANIEIESQKDFVAHGLELQAIEGYLHFEFDPALPQNQNIVDLALAEQNNGKVKARSRFYLVQHKDPKARKASLVEISNRGSKASIRYFNKADSRDLPNNEKALGDGLLQRMGLSVMWIGWQADVFAENNNMSVTLPRAAGSKGFARSDWTVEKQTSTLRVAHRDSIDVMYHLDRNNTNKAYLTKRQGPNAVKTMVAKDAWQFSENGDEIQGDFSPGIYELIYPTQESVVLGLGFALIRDTAEYLKTKESMFYSPKTIAFGVSQTGRWLRHFLYQGFNQTESNTKAFDGMLIHTAGAGRGSFNHRFGQPSRDAHRMSAFFYPTDVFPYTSRETAHPITEEKDGLLKHLPPEYHPKIFYTNTGYEYWGRAAALIHSHQGNDIAPLENERIFHLASGQHFVERQSNLKAIAGVDGYFQGNPLNFLLNLRALLGALTEWVTTNESPPNSQYPKYEDGSLVPFENYQLPSLLEGVAIPKSPHTAYIYDYGPQWSQGIINQNPPRILATIAPAVPKVDDFGNELGGIRHPLVQEPLASFLPWVLRHQAEFAQEEMMDFRGSIKLISNERVLKQYINWQAYSKQLNAAIDEEVANGTLLEEDRADIQAQGKWLWNKLGIE